MAEYNPDISQLFNAAFGISSQLIRYNVSSAEEREQYELIYKGSEASELYEDQVTSSLGTPVAFPIKLQAGVYRQYKDGEIIEKSMGDMLMPFTTLCDFRRAKIMNKTKVNGGYGTVKEVYGHDDWQIRMRGLILKDQNDSGYVNRVMQELKSWDDLVDSIEVSGRVFELLDIYRINIISIEFLQVKGAPNVRPFEIIAESDEPLELLI